MSFHVFFGLSTGLAKPMKCPKGTLESLVRHAASIEELLCIKRKKYQDNPEYWGMFDYSVVNTRGVQGQLNTNHKKPSTMRTNIAPARVTEPVPGLEVRTETTTVETSTATPSRSKLQFGKIASKKAEASKYPVVPDELGKLKELAKSLREIRAKKAAILGADAVTSGALAKMILPFYWQHYQGKSVIESSVEIDAGDDNRILAMLGSKFSIPKDGDKRPDLDAFFKRALATIGDRYKLFFRDGFIVKVDGDKIPAEKQQDFLNGINDLCIKMGIDPSCVEGEPTIKHTEEFKIKRHSMLTPVENAALNAIYPTVVAFKTEGTK